MTELTQESWLNLFETAMREARRVATSGQEGPSNIWSTSALPGDEHK